MSRYVIAWYGTSHLLLLSIFPFMPYGLRSLRILDRRLIVLAFPSLTLFSSFLYSPGHYLVTECWTSLLYSSSTFTLIILWLSLSEPISIPLAASFHNIILSLLFRVWSSQTFHIWLNSVCDKLFSVYFICHI